MIEFEIAEIRKYNKYLAPQADFDSEYTFYYDETNNIKKLYLRDGDFNYSLTSNFVLGGLVHEGNALSMQPLIDELRLQKTTKEIKFKHIATGEFLDCLKSEKLLLVLKFIETSNLYVHLSSLNLLYWSLTDIVDSAILKSKEAIQLGKPFADRLKNDLYKLAKIELAAVTELFYTFKYPNIEKQEITSFIDRLILIFQDYIDDPEYHFGLESLRQILKQAKKQEDLPFIMDEDDHILVKDFSHFYLRAIYTFKNAAHIFDNEMSISEIVSNYKITDNGHEIKNYSFVDSQSSNLIQFSDIVVGIFGKLSYYFNINRNEKILEDFNSLSQRQKENIKSLVTLVDKSHSKNSGFLHQIDAYEELTKFQLLRNI